MKEGCSTRKNLLVVIGGRGKLGLVMIKAAMAASHKVTAFVEDAELLRDPVTGKLPSGLAVILGCPSKEVALVAVLKGFDVVINTAGVEDGARECEAVTRAVVGAAAKVLAASARLWLLGGVGALQWSGNASSSSSSLSSSSTPSSSSSSSDMQDGASPQHRVHRRNWEYAREHAPALDWSMLCPGHMVAAPQRGAPPVSANLHLTSEVLPFELSWLERRVPDFVLRLLLQANLPKATITYDEAAHVVLSHLAPKGPYFQKRVGVVNADLRDTMLHRTPSIQGPPLHRLPSPSYSSSASHSRSSSMSHHSVSLSSLSSPTRRPSPRERNLQTFSI